MATDTPLDLPEATRIIFKMVDWLGRSNATLHVLIQSVYTTQVDSSAIRIVAQASERELQKIQEQFLAEMLELPVAVTEELAEAFRRTQ